MEEFNKKIATVRSKESKKEREEIILEIECLVNLLDKNWYRRLKFYYFNDAGWFLSSLVLLTIGGLVWGIIEYESKIPLAETWILVTIIIGFLRLVIMFYEGISDKRIFDLIEYNERRLASLNKSTGRHYTFRHKEVEKQNDLD